VFDLHVVIGESIRFLEHSLDKSIEIESFLEAENAVMRGDPTQIHQMLLNLALNARDAMPEGGSLTFSTRTVHLDRESCAGHPELPAGNCIELIVADTGCGMDLDVQMHVFEPFYTTKPVGQGTGLGLSSVYGFVKMHNGSIRVESEKGCGTRFMIHFPMSRVAEVPNGWNNAERAIHAGRGTVLIVDDEEEIRTVLRAQLERSGYQAKECADGVEAVDFFRRYGRDVDAVILDVVMPRSNGVECFAKMKMIDPDVKVLLMSGYAVDEQCRTMLDGGARGFIEKPFGEEEVSRKLAEVLAH
jgi:CheY-like chemotaxis protein